MKSLFSVLFIIILTFSVFSCSDSSSDEVFVKIVKKESVTETESIEETASIPKKSISPESAYDANNTTDYILNLNSMRFHFPSCSSVDDMAQHNKSAFSGTRDELISQGYIPCGRCKP